MRSGYDPIFFRFRNGGDGGGAGGGEGKEGGAGGGSGAGDGSGGGEKTFSQAELDAAVKKAAADARAAEAKRLKDEAERKKLADDGEYQKLLDAERKEKSDLQARIEAMELAERKRAAATKHNLPAEWANRLQGDTEEELETDAKALAATIPAQDPGGNGGVGNPGGNRSGKLNKDQIAELARTNPDEFNRRWEKGEFNEVMQGR